MTTISYGNSAGKSVRAALRGSGWPSPMLESLAGAGRFFDSTGGVLASLVIDLWRGCRPDTGLDSRDDRYGRTGWRRASRGARVRAGAGGVNARHHHIQAALSHRTGSSRAAFHPRGPSMRNFPANQVTVFGPK